MITPFFKKDLFLNNIGRKVFKIPMGIAIYRQVPDSIKIFEDIKNMCNPPIIVSIGDVVTHNLLRYNEKSNLAVIDKKTLRIKNYAITEELLESYEEILFCKNPRGIISKNCSLTIRKGIKSCLNDKYVLIIVGGEEDLLVLPSIIFSPNKTFIVYGHWKGSLNVLIVSNFLKKLTLESIRKFFK